MDALRDEARKRAQSKQSGQASSEAKHANEAISHSTAPDDRRQPPTPVDPMPSAAIKVPAAHSCVVTIQQPPSVGRSVARPRDRDVRVPSSAPKMDAQAHHALLAELAKQYLPLREVTQSEGGRERTLVILVFNLAVPDDADLIKQAIAQQHLAQYQEQFRDRYDAFLAGVRATLIGQPATNPENWRAVLNPGNDARLAAAIAAAEGSPSFKALIPTAETHQAFEGLSMVEQQMTDIRRGHGSRT